MFSGKNTYIEKKALINSFSPPFLFLSLFDFTEENKDNKHDLSLCTWIDLFYKAMK